MGNFLPSYRVKLAMPVSSGEYMALMGDHWTLSRSLLFSLFAVL